MYTVIEKLYDDGKHTRENVCNCRNIETAMGLIKYLNIEADIEDSSNGKVIYSHSKDSFNVCVPK